MLTVITGCMYSGKTSKLISMCMANIIAGNNIVVFKPDNDTRYSATNIVSHNLDKFTAIPINKDAPQQSYNIIASLNERLPLSAIFFDETQFFGKDIVSCVEDCLKWNYEVICAGLAQDSNGKSFGSMPTLLSMADNIITLKAVCSRCKSIEKATRTLRKVKSTEQVLVGGADKYEATCYSCWKAFNEI